MRFGVIYTIVHRATGRAYVGQTTQSNPVRRWWAHQRAAQSPPLPVHKALAKYGLDAFEFAIVEECDTREGLNAAECRWIETLGTLSPAGYNLTSGGGEASGWSLSAEARQKMSASRICKRHSPETRAKIGAAHHGRKQPREQVERRAAARRGKKLPEGARAVLMRAVVAEGVTFPSMSAAAEHLGVSVTTIGRRIAAGLSGYSSHQPPRQRRPRTAAQVAAIKEINRRQVLAAGQQFAALTDAAAVLSITRQAVRWRIQAGKEGYAYL